MGEKKKGRGEGDKAHRLRAYYPSKISDIAYVTSAHPRAGLRRAEHHQPIPGHVSGRVCMRVMVSPCKWCHQTWPLVAAISPPCHL